MTRRRGLYTPYRHDANVSSMLVTLLPTPARFLKVAFTEMSQTNATTPCYKRSKPNLKLCVYSLLIWSRVSSNSHTHVGSNGGRCPRLPSCSSSPPLAGSARDEGKTVAVRVLGGWFVCCLPPQWTNWPADVSVRFLQLQPADYTLSTSSHASFITSCFEFQNKEGPEDILFHHLKLICCQTISCTYYSPKKIKIKPK